MLFLDFLCLFFCAVLLNAHPISKSDSHNISELMKESDNGHIIQPYYRDQLINDNYSNWKGQIFEEQNGKIGETHKSDFSKIPKKLFKFKRITTKVMDLRDFERLENFGNKKYILNSIKTYKAQDQENLAANNLKDRTDSHLKPLSSFFEDKHVFYNDVSMEPTRDNAEFVGTAEIEAILNEIKQREIQMIADQMPSVSNVIANTVTETTFASMPLIRDSSIYPGFVFSTFLVVDNKSLINFENYSQGRYLHNSKYHNIALRSIKDDSSTLAHDVENVLQKNIKKVYHKIKNKIKKDFNKEIKKTKATIKEQIRKMDKIITNIDSKNCSLLKTVTKPIPKTITKSKLPDGRSTRKPFFGPRKNKHKPTTLTTHTIPNIGDDLSMLSIVEQLLEKSEEDNVINILTTKNSYSAKKDREKLFKRNSLNYTLKQRNRKLLNNEVDVLDTEYTHSDNSINNQTDVTTEDTSYEGLSNKLSYNDYVNGYKYYLNFQRDKEDQKYSNQVRYQAHKHHSVDDVGKFILNKIPQLPKETRLRRDFVESATFDVQEVSTKSEDSWFKKHFFMFLDSNTPKKFHTSQTVSLKPSGIQTDSIIFSNPTTKQTYKTKSFKSLNEHRFKKNTDEAKKFSTKTPPSDDISGCNIETEARRRSRILRKLSKRSNSDNNDKQKSDILSNINYRKNGFVDIDMVNKPTAIIKLKNKNMKTNKIRNIFHKIRFGHNKNRKKGKRESQSVFNIFKGIKNIFKEKNEGDKEINSTRGYKLFDYEVVTSNANESYEVPKFKKLLKIDEIRQQIPNISAEFSTHHTRLSVGYSHLTELVSVIPGQSNQKMVYKKKPALDDQRSFSILTGSQYLKDNQKPEGYQYFTDNISKKLRFNEILNVNLKPNTNHILFPEKSSTDIYPSIVGMTKNLITNEVNNMKMRLSGSGANRKAQTTFSTYRGKGYKNQLLNSFNTYQKSTLSKDYEIEKLLIDNIKQNNKVTSKKPETISGTANILFLPKKPPRFIKSFFLINSNYSLAPISSLRPLKDKKFEIITKSNSQDIALKKYDFQPTSFVYPTIVAYGKKSNNLTMPYKRIVLKKNKQRPYVFEDPTMFAYKITSSSLPAPERELVESCNNNVDTLIKRPLTKVSTPPDQYYSTPLPMQMDDFYKFLKSQNIDVESVTAPLFDSVPKPIDTWSLYKKNVSKLSTKHNKTISGKKNKTTHKIQHLKKNHNKNLEGGGQSKPKLSHTKIKTLKKVQAKPLLEKKKGFDVGKANNGNAQETGETPEYENNNYLLCYQKHNMSNLRRNSNMMSQLNLGSMDLFQFNNLPKQPVVNSQKEAKGIDVTVIDLGTKKSDSETYKGLYNTIFNKINKYQQLRTRTNSLNNSKSHTTFIDLDRDPLRFTHMSNEHNFSKQSKSPICNYSQKKTTLSPKQPRRIQITGHSYKYDIIYLKSNYNGISDIYEVNPTLFPDDLGNYKNDPTTVKKDEDSDQWYYRGNDTEYQNNDIISFPSKKIKKEIYNSDHPSPGYILAGVQNIVLPKKKLQVLKMKNKKNIFFTSKKVKNINDEVYFEPLIRHKSNRRKCQGKVSNNKKCYKRDIQGQDLFTAKDVAALEIVVDLMKSTESYEDKGFRNTFLDIDGQKNINYIVPSCKSQNHATNTIQVHIALSSNINDKKRSLEPIKLRKIFSAVMSSPVDIEYQIHSYEDHKVTKSQQDVISPGLYLLVENNNLTVPKGYFALKPIRSHIGISNLILPKSSQSTLHYNNNITDAKIDDASKVTLNPDVIAAVNNQLVKLYENVASLNETKFKRFINKEERYENKQKIKRNINLETVKKYFGHDRVCHCRCKINETMCKPCAACDAVITELNFEFNNLANYMIDHCTEIQTFFWMNPTGGRKLKDTVHRIDTILNNYYKRVKGKCQGHTCKMLTTNIDKREYKIKNSMNQFFNDLESLADLLQEVVKNSIIYYDANVFNAGKRCVTTINKCIDKNLNKRSYVFNTDEFNNKSIYSLNNIRVNLICNKEITRKSQYFTKNTITEVLFERATNTPLYYDDDEKKIYKKKGKGIKDLLKMYSNKFKIKKLETSHIDMKNNKKLTKNHKRNSISYNQIEAPFLADSGGTFWHKYLHDNMREPRQQKDVLKKINTKSVHSNKFHLLNINLSTTKNERDKKNADIRMLSKNNIQEKANETDESFLNIETFNHNLNDLFKLLGSFDTVQGNKSELSKLTTPSKKPSNTKIHTSIQTGSKVINTTKIRTTTRPSSKTTFKKDDLKIVTFKSQKKTNKGTNKKKKATKTVSTKTLTPVILPTIKTTINNSKIGLFNRIVSGSLKFLVNNDNKNDALTETKSSSIDHRLFNEYLKNYRQKFGVNTEKYLFKENYNYGNISNENLTTLTEPTIIIIDGLGSSDKYGVSINSRILGKNYLTEYRSPDTAKRNSFKLLKEKSCGESSEDDMNDIGLNSINNRIKLENTTSHNSQSKNCEYCDYDIIHSIRKSLGLTSSNLTTPRERKGALNNFFDEFSIKIIPDDKKIEPDKINLKNNMNSPNVASALNVVKQFSLGIQKNTSDTTIKPSNTTKKKSNKDLSKQTTAKTTHTQSTSSSLHHITKPLKEAGEEKLNQICDISSTMAYVSKLQKSMLKTNFEQYVKNIPCHKYNKTPQHFIVRSYIRKPSKTYSKLYRKSKTFDCVNRKRLNKWAWIRNKRTLLKDESRVEDYKGKHFQDLDKNCLSGYSVPFIVNNCVNVDKENGNEEVIFQTDVKKNIKITDDYNIKKQNIKKNVNSPKLYNIIHDIGFQKRNLLSFSNYLLRRRGYKKNSDLNGNFIQLWYGENDYYENFVRGKDGIYRKSLKRRKRLDADMSELNEELLNLPPLEPLTDEIYVMVANSISLDCHVPGQANNWQEEYIWTSDRHGTLDFDNVMIEGPKVFINKIKTKNFGNYFCSAKNAVIRSIKITVIDLPNINIVFTPLYETDTCAYDDLKSLQKLSEPLSYFTSKYNCSFRIDEPICLKNSEQVDGSALIRPIIVMSVKRQTYINCSAECLRDLQCSLALLFAKNAPVLALVKVLILYNGTKRILYPLRERKKSFVTHTLRRKDTNGHQEYHRLAADMDPNSVNVVLLCSAGFYLIVGQKICAVCPPNTFSLEGENVCSNCPRGARSEPGARSCRFSMKENLRKNKLLHLKTKAFEKKLLLSSTSIVAQCLWKYVCGGAACMLSCVIASCYAVSRLLRQPVSTEEIKTGRKTRQAPSKESHQKESKSRPLSPSRVILSRLLRGSLSSSRATDSQETRFELWKEKNTLPPLPPIDFEL